jgi:hypothetical protein
MIQVCVLGGEKFVEIVLGDGWPLIPERFSFAFIRYFLYNALINRKGHGDGRRRFGIFSPAAAGKSRRAAGN